VTSQLRKTSQLPEPREHRRYPHLTLCYPFSMADAPNISRVTKRNWDVLLLPVLCISLFLAVFLAAFANFYRAFELPAFTLLIWLLLRFTTPSHGMKAVAITGNPKAKALLKWLSFFIVLTAGWVFLHIVVLGNSFDTPLSTPQIVGFVLIDVLLLIGVFVIERRYPNDPKSPPSSG
jgi:hypothetical protein